MLTTRMLLIVIVVLFSSLQPCESAPNQQCPPLANITHPSPLITEKNQFGMTASSSNTSSGAVVTLKCNDDVTLTLSGKGVITCVNGKWHPPQPYCIPRPPPPIPNDPHLDVIIGGTLAGCLLVLLLVSVPEVIKKGRAWRLKRIKQKSLIEENNPKRFYKVWTCGRNTKQFIKAKDLSGLKREASRTFKKPSIARIVLEEDGTEIDTDGILDACADNTLMALTEGELWWDRNVNSDDGRLDEKRLTFDVCNQDRTKRKLILAANLRDLCRQGHIVFDYLPLSACLESDGTMIDHDALFAFAESTIMLLDKGGSWTPSLTSVQTLPDVDRPTTNNSSKDEMMFKVWSRDQSMKLVVFARNLADLHIKAAKAHGVPNPLEILVYSTGYAVTSDRHLTSLANEILLIKPLNKAGDINYESIDTIDKFEPTGDTRSSTERPSKFHSQLSTQWNQDYTNVPKQWSNRDRPSNSYQSVPFSSKQHEQRSAEIPLSSVYTAPENVHAKNGMLNKSAGNPVYDLWSEKSTNEHSLKHPFEVQDQQSTTKNNFGFLREMSNKAKGRQNFYEMNNLNPEFQSNHSDYPQKPLVVTGGAKQTTESDVLF
ncbi:uncharacterized protein [Argopecten irradians]|uniref:uncharacterized protein n=1 Tax=Argopecten irradians TaxID=31199 RepID=UPI003722DF89